MATAVHMQPPVSRPSMDRNPSSFDQPRSRSTPPFATHYEQRSPSPNVHHPAAYHQHPPQHVRSNSNASAASPYGQPYPSSYFPPSGQMYSVGIQPAQTAWTSTALPANAFYPAHIQSYPGQVFHQGFQQSQADFAAWATAYHHMVAASMASGANQGQNGGMAPPQPEYLTTERRRTSSGPSSSSTYSQGYDLSQPTQQQSQPHNLHYNPSQRAQQPAPYHPYKRDPSRRPSRENVGGAIPRSASNPNLQPAKHSPESSVSSRPTSEHNRAPSIDSSHSKASIVAPPRTASRQSYTPDAAQQIPRSSSTTPRAASPALPKSSSSPTTRTSQPLLPGPIASATNTPQGSAAPRPSPLSQSNLAHVESEKTKSGGLKSRLKRALDKDVSTPKKPVAGTLVRTSSKPTFASPSESSTRSMTPPTTPPQDVDLAAPSAPFAVAHQSAMGSEVSLAETERTATAPSEMGTTTGKSKRSLFRMKNMSTDNISLSSTVSSASMMIRKMGSLGKLARRNSLMGISKVFNRPKGDDAPLPEKEGKKSKKKDKKDKSKAGISPATISRATAESDRDLTLRVSEDEDRALAGLSPAAKLARQHTLKSRAEAAKKEVGKTGEPAWDNNTATRQANGVLPSISAVAGGATPATEIKRIIPGRTSTVVHAVAVSEHEYDSEDDSSDGETLEDVTTQLGKTRLSDGTADREFREAWGNAYIDRHAVPKKGILKNTVSFENLERTVLRQRSSSTAEIPHSSSTPGPMSVPSADADQIDGLHHPAPQNAKVDDKYNPLSPDFAPFDSPTHSAELHFPYSNPIHNTSAPALSLIDPNKPVATRSLTVPARKRLVWAPDCAVYSTYDAGTYDRRSEPATCNNLTPQLAMSIKQELNAFKLEMPVHPQSRTYTHFFA